MLSPSVARPSAIEQAIDGVMNADGPKDAAKALLDVCVETTQADGGQINLLDLRTSRYAQYNPGRGHAGSLSIAPAVDDIEFPPDRILALDTLPGVGAVGDRVR